MSTRSLLVIDKDGIPFGQVYEIPESVTPQEVVNVLRQRLILDEDNIIEVPIGFDSEPLPGGTWAVAQAYIERLGVMRTAKQNELRELDAEVAVALMRYQWVKRLYNPGVEGPVWTRDGKCGLVPRSFLHSKLNYIKDRPAWEATDSVPPIEERFGDWAECADEIVPYYSSEIQAAWEVEEEIERRGLQEQYGKAMDDLLESPFVPTSYFNFLDLLHASPEIRCRAALIAVKTAKETP